MSAECAEIREKRRKFLKAVYDLAHGRPTAHVSKADVASRLGMHVGNREEFDEIMAIVQYYDDLGCIRTFQRRRRGGYQPRRVRRLSEKAPSWQLVNRE